MKKLFLILFTIVLSASAWAQSQRSTLRGKDKDGKTLTVQYYQGIVEDRIESVKYQLVDELQAEIKNLKYNIKDLQNQLDATKREVKELNKQLGKTSGNQGDVTALTQQIEEKNREIAQLSAQLAGLNNDLKLVQDKNNRLQDLLDSIKAMPTPNIPKEPRPQKTPVIGVEADLGAVLLGKSANELWAKDITMGTQLAVYFGTARLSESFPISFEAGIGLRRFTMAAHLSQCEYRDDVLIQDKDGDSYMAIYSFDGLSERLSLNYLDIPIRICIGQPAREQVSVYAKLGVTPSLNIGTPAIDGKGTYGVKGYYPDWDVTLANIQELGFENGRNFYKENEVVTEINKFNLWANLTLGAYMPFKGSPVVLNVGFKLDYPILQVGETNFKDDTKQPHKWHTGLLNNGGKVLIPSFEIGLVYTLK